MKSLQDRVVLITGGTSGIGLALAQAFAGAGAKVAVCGRDEARLSATRRVVPNALCITADVTDEGEVATMLGAVACHSTAAPWPSGAADLAGRVLDVRDLAPTASPGADGGGIWAPARRTCDKITPPPWRSAIRNP